jgi:hypothetical protein
MPESTSNPINPRIQPPEACAGSKPPLGIIQARQQNLPHTYRQHGFPIHAASMPESTSNPINPEFTTEACAGSKPTLGIDSKVKVIKDKG